MSFSSSKNSDGSKLFSFFNSTVFSFFLLSDLNSLVLILYLVLLFENLYLLKDLYIYLFCFIVSNTKLQRT